MEFAESLEAAVRREVLEETNVRIAKLRYVTSEPWPYPASLMFAFRARAASADIRCNDGELAEARWFSRAELATALRCGALRLPSRRSVAYRLIRDWYGERGDSLDAVLAARPAAART